MITFNITGLEEVRERIAGLKNLDPLLLEIASSLKAKIKYRIHVEGKAADGSKIGTYSPEYMKVRTGNFGNSVVYKKGKNKGEIKKSGIITRGSRKGQPRPNYQRTSDTNVVLSLSREMEMDIDATQPIKIEGGYGIGFTNDFNYNKAVWNEKRYGKQIYGVSNEENQIVEEIVKNYVKKNG